MVRSIATTLLPFHPEPSHITGAAVTPFRRESSGIGRPGRLPTDLLSSGLFEKPSARTRVLALALGMVRFRQGKKLGGFDRLTGKGSSGVFAKDEYERVESGRRVPADQLEPLHSREVGIK